MRRLHLTLIGVLVAVTGMTLPPLTAQPGRSRGGTYAAVLGTYAVDRERAIATISTWTPDAIDEGVGALPDLVGPALASPDRAAVLLERMVLLHSEAAMSLYVTGTDSWRLHLTWAHRIIHGDVPWPDTRRFVVAAEVPAFHTDWALALAGFFQQMLAFPDGRRFLDTEIEAVPGNAMLLLARGSLDETAAADRAQPAVGPTRRVSPYAEVRMRVSPAERTRRRQSMLGHAAAFYERALALDPDLADARLRLGRVSFERGDMQTAGMHLARVFATHDDDVPGYLARLFLGEVRRAEDRHDAARRLFEDALRLFPAAQAPWLGLSRLAVGANPGTAAAAVRHMFEVRPPDDDTVVTDPWWLYDAGFGASVIERLANLRRAVHQ